MARKQSAGPVQSLERGLQVLNAIARASGPMSLPELVRAVKFERSCVFRLATTLTRQGFLSQSPRTKEYSLGAAIWELVGHMQRSSPLLVLTRKHVMLLAEQLGETAHLSVRQDDRAISLEHQLTPQVVGVMAAAGRSELLYCSAVGKALISDFSLEELRELFGGETLKARTERTIKRVTDLFEECQRGASRGYAIDDEEHTEGVRCIAVPVRDYRGDIVAAIGMSAPSSRLPKQRIATVGELVKRAAAELSRELGFVLDRKAQAQ